MTRKAVGSLLLRDSMHKSKERCLTILCLIAFLATCATPAATTSGLSDDEQAKLDEYKLEIEIGRNMAGRLLAFYGTQDKKDLVDYVNRIATYIASNGDFPERRYMVAILDSDTVNAFACPGGYILLTAGAIKLAENEAELAAILGHEVAHVGKRHMFTTLKTMSDKERDEAAEEADKAPALTSEVELRARPKPETSDIVGETLAKYIAGSTGVGVGVLQAAKAGMSVILKKGLDKDLEFEADQEGVRYAVNAGYDPKALVEYLERLAKSHGAINSKILERTHPKPTDRMDRINKQLVAMEAAAIAGAVGKKRFLKHRAMITSTKKERS